MEFMRLSNNIQFYKRKLAMCRATNARIFYEKLLAKEAKRFQELQLEYQRLDLQYQQLTPRTNKDFLQEVESLEDSVGFEDQEEAENPENPEELEDLEELEGLDDLHDSEYNFDSEDPVVLKDLKDTVELMYLEGEFMIDIPAQSSNQFSQQGYDVKVEKTVQAPQKGLAAEDPEQEAQEGLAVAPVELEEMPQEGLAVDPVELEEMPQEGLDEEPLEPEQTPQEGSELLPNEVRVFTIDELSQYNGAGGKPAYVAVNGIVYDVSSVIRWRGGRHFGMVAGKNLTMNFNACHAGSIEVLTRLPQVGIIE